MLAMQDLSSRVIAHEVQGCWMQAPPDLFQPTDKCDQFYENAGALELLPLTKCPSSNIDLGDFDGIEIRTEVRLVPRILPKVVVRAYTSRNQSSAATHETPLYAWGRARCVFPKAWYAGAESGVSAAAENLSCAATLPCGPVTFQTSSKRSFFATFGDAFAALLAPSDCHLCGSPLLRAADYAVCPECIDRVVTAKEPARCQLCAEPLPLESLAMQDLARSVQGTCFACSSEPPRFVRAVTGGSYDGLRPAIHLMKFEAMPGLARPLAPLLARAIYSLRPQAPDAMTVVPVPLFRGKRGYNQSTLLAKEALRLIRSADPTWALSLEPGLLRRVRRTESQYLLSHAQRRQNVRGAFLASDLHGRHVLLVDDVYTSGATIEECTRVLQRAGAETVHVATLARASREISVRWTPTSLPVPRDGPLPATNQSLH